jgi:hypothetical protein
MSELTLDLILKAKDMVEKAKAPKGVRMLDRFYTEQELEQAVADAVKLAVHSERERCAKAVHRVWEENQKDGLFFDEETYNFTQKVLDGIKGVSDG